MKKNFLESAIQSSSSEAGKDPLDTDEDSIDEKGSRRETRSKASSSKPTPEKGQDEEFQDAFLKHVLQNQSKYEQFYPDAKDRVLDSIARFISSDSMCAAVYERGENTGKLVFAFNNDESELDSNEGSSSTDTLPESVQSLVAYMNDYKKGTLNDDEDTQKKLISKAREAAVYKGSRGTKPRSFKYTGKSSITPEHDLKKIRKSLDNEGRFSDAEEEITAEMTSTTGHAETQVMAEIIRDKGEEGYIGISKICCPRCDMLIDAINTVQKKKIEARGHHNQWDRKWPLPAFLKLEQNKKIFYTFIGDEAKKIFETHLKNQSNWDNTMKHFAPSISCKFNGDRIKKIERRLDKPRQSNCISQRQVAFTSSSSGDEENQFLSTRFKNKKFRKSRFGPHNIAETTEESTLKTPPRTSKRTHELGSTGSTPQRKSTKTENISPVRRMMTEFYSPSVNKKTPPSSKIGR